MENIKNKEQAGFIFLLLAGLFIAALITCNLVANKFITVDLGFKTFVISAGVLPYPLTFLITDILSEMYGRRRTNAVVAVGFFSSVLTLFILLLGHSFPAIAASPVSDNQFDEVFRNSWRVIGASMLAYLVAQFIDIRIFHYWKQKTNGKHLWLRNNFSTILSQLLDTILVVSVIFVGQLSAGEMGVLIADGWLFKVIFAAADTLVIYAVVYGFRSYFNLKPNQELDF